MKCERECGKNKDNEFMNVYWCSYCGQYDYQMTIEPDTYIDQSKFYKVSSYIREQNDEFNKIPTLNNEKFNKILDHHDKKIKEKFDLMMDYLSKTKREDFRSNEDLIVKCWIKDDNEFFILYQKVINDGYVKGNCTGTLNGGGSYSFTELTYDGIEYIEQLEQPNKNSKNIFVAFNFNNDLKNIFNIHLKEAIETEGFEYIVVNQDNVEHDKSINDEIIVKLKTSRIVIADFTNHRNSVYFEAGFAMGMNIPIIWTCQKGHEGDMSFDTRQFPHIVWEDKDDLVKQVTDRIKRIL